jgi:hypothetical protein
MQRKERPVTREEFIGRAADAILRKGGFNPDAAHLGLKRLPPPATDATMEMLAVGERLRAIEKATAALGAVGAWETRVACKLLADAPVVFPEDVASEVEQCREALAIAEKR